MVPPACLIAAGALCAMPWASSETQLMQLVAVYSLGATLFQSTPTAYVADITQDFNRGQALAMLRSAGDLGLMLGAASFGYLSMMTSVNTAFAVASGLMLVGGGNFVLTAKEASRTIVTSGSASTSPAKKTGEGKPL